MFGATVWLTLATLLGLAVGFARETLLVASWGATSRSDAFLVAMFIPEAVRMALAAGLLASAALPLWLRLPPGLPQTRWAVTQTLHVSALGAALAALLVGAAEGWVSLIGPGMAPASHAQAAGALRILGWTLPGILLQALLSIFHIARHRYLLSGLGSLVYNLPAVLYLCLYRAAGTNSGLAWSFVVGSILMTALLVPGAWKGGWRPAGARAHWSDVAVLYQSLVPLLVGSAASQALTLVERIVASQLGEGAITVVNLARKLINIPLIGLASLSQVLLSQMSTHARAADRIDLLRTALSWATLLAGPATVGLIFGATPLVALLLPDQVSHTRLPDLMRLFALALVFGSWNSLLARYFYARADVRTPLKFELGGNAVTLLLAVGLPPLYGLAGLPIAATAGVMATTILLIRSTPLAAHARRHALHTATAAIAAASVWMIVSRLPPASDGAQLLVAFMLAVSTLAGLAVWLKPRRETG